MSTYEVELSCGKQRDLQSKRVLIFFFTSGSCILARTSVCSGSTEGESSHLVLVPDDNDHVGENVVKEVKEKQ